MSAGEVEVKGLFATPVAALMLPNADRLNAELEAAILQHRSARQTVGASNIGGWRSTRNFASWSGKPAEQVLTVARSVATHLTADRDGKPVKPDWTIEAWANVNAPGDSNSCHYHPGSFSSGSYYVNDGGCADDPSLGGEFEIFDPRGPRR